MTSTYYAELYIWVFTLDFGGHTFTGKHRTEHIEHGLNKPDMSI